jgi:type IV pilus assembly protein PilC
MPNYRYQVKTTAGDMQVGVIASDSVATAASVLRNQGHRVVSVAPVLAAGATSGFMAKLAELNAGKPRQRHVLEFTTQLAVMIRAGINLRAALDGIADQTEHPLFKKIILGLKTDVESGKQFSEALARHPKLFGPLYINMTRASEVSGSFAKMLDRIAGYIAQEIDTRKMVVGASIYPGVIGTMAVSVTIFLLTFVLPKFRAVFQGKEEVLPWATKFLMALSDFMVADWYFVVGGIVLIIGSLVAVSKTEVGGWWFDRMRLTIPVVRSMFRALYISRSLHTMGQLINAGVPMLDTLAITGDISGNRMYRSMWRTVYSSVKQGKKIASPLQKTNLLPQAVSQMISAGEESGKLGEVLDEISAYYQKQLREKIKAVTSMIEPIMIILMGSVVGFIAMAIILPIFKMSSLVK